MRAGPRLFPSSLLVVRNILTGIDEVCVLKPFVHSFLHLLPLLPVHQRFWFPSRVVVSFDTPPTFLGEKVHLAQGGIEVPFSSP